MSAKGGRRESQKGVGLVEVMLAMMILLVGLLTLLALFAQGIATTQAMQMDMIARQEVRESMESIFTARNTQQITYDQIQNTDSGGIFVGGFQPLRSVGVDGLAGTQDDGSIQSMRLPGLDGAMNTADDELIGMERFQREIRIEPVIEAGQPSGDLRQVTITIAYRTPLGIEREYRVQTYISRYR